MINHLKRFRYVITWVVVLILCLVKVIRFSKQHKITSVKEYGWTRGPLVNKRRTTTSRRNLRS